MKNPIKRIACIFGKHAEPVYNPLKPEIKIMSINRDEHLIEYANVMRCPNCGKVLRLDYSK